MWAELLGFGDYYFELGVQILEACWASRPLNGGLMELSALRWVGGGDMACTSGWRKRLHGWVDEWDHTSTAAQARLPTPQLHTTPPIESSPSRNPPLPNGTNTNTTRAAVVKRRGAMADPVSEDDITRSFKKLKCLGGGLDLVTIGKVAYVRSVPGELNLDKNKALELAQDKGWLSQPELCSRAGWSAQRAGGCLEELLKEGLAMIDDGGAEGRLWWFPACSAQAGAAAAAAGGGGATPTGDS